jgi:hypothetical protein
MLDRKNALSIIIFVLLCNTSLFCFGKEAAMEIEEGNVENWIKYYQRERGIKIDDSTSTLDQIEVNSTTGQEDVSDTAVSDDGGGDHAN